MKKLCRDRFSNFTFALAEKRSIAPKIFVPLYLEKFRTDFQTVFTDVFGLDQKKTKAIWEFSEMSHLRTIVILNVRKSVFWTLRLYYWTNALHIWNIDASGHLQKLWLEKFSFFSLALAEKGSIAPKSFSVVSPLIKDK